MPALDPRRTTCFALILAAAAVPRIFLAAGNQGIFWPDEIFQSLEQAHRFAFGYGFVPWEFQDGARSWLFPGVLGSFWKLLAMFGVRSAPALVIAARLLMAGIAVAGVYATMRLAEKLGGAEAAVLAGAFAAAFPPALVYGSRAMTEMASGPLLAGAALLALDSGRRRLALAGFLGAVAIFLRYQNGLVAAALLLWLLIRRRREDALFYSLGAVVAVLAGGLLDWFTWGAPFHSFVAYVRFNLVEGRSASFGVEPPLFYVEVFGTATGFAILAVVAGLAACVGRATGLLLVVFLYVFAHSLVAHKEFRFMMPIVPLMLALAGVGLARMFSGTAGSRRTAPARDTKRRGAVVKAPEPVSGFRVRLVAWVLAAGLAGAMSWQAARASFDDFGQRRGTFSGAQPLWHNAEAVNRLLWAAGERPDLCGLALVGYGPIWTGGYSYLHRDVPVIWISERQVLAEGTIGAVGAATNYVIARAGVPLPAEYVIVSTIGEAKLARRAGACAAPPASYSRNFRK